MNYITSAKKPFYVYFFKKIFMRFFSWRPYFNARKKSPMSGSFMGGGEEAITTTKARLGR